MPATATPQLGPSQLQKAHQLGCGPEGVGQRPATSEGQRRNELPVDLCDEDGTRGH
jgi:hypothetical protein